MGYIIAALYILPGVFLLGWELLAVWSKAPKAVTVILAGCCVLTLLAIAIWGWYTVEGALGVPLLLWPLIWWPVRWLRKGGLLRSLQSSGQSSPLPPAGNDEVAALNPVDGPLDCGICYTSGGAAQFIKSCPMHGSQAL